MFWFNTFFLRLPILCLYHSRNDTTMFLMYRLVTKDKSKIFKSFFNVILIVTRNPKLTKRKKQMKVKRRKKM